MPGFKKRLAFQLRDIKKNKGSSGEGIWNTKRQPGSSCISPDVVAFTHAKGTQCRVAMFNIGFMSAFQLRGIKQNRGSSGETVWIIKRKPGNHCKSYEEG